MTVPGARAGADVAPAHAHARARPTASTTRTRSTASTATTASSSARRRAWTSRRASTRGRACRCCSSPAREFNYCVSTDVLGRVVEVALRPDARRRSSSSASSTRSGMTDTAFGAADPDRLAALYAPGLVRNDRAGRGRAAAPAFLSGGGGLVSHRGRLPPLHAACCSAGRAGRRRLLGTAYAALHGPQPPARRRRAEGRRAADDLRDPERRAWASGSGSRSCSTRRRTKVALPRRASSPGAGWPAPAFWVDPQERITAQFFTQLVPSSTYPLRSQLRQLVYQALVD